MIDTLELISEIESSLGNVDSVNTDISIPDEKLHIAATMEDDETIVGVDGFLVIDRQPNVELTTRINVDDSVQLDTDELRGIEWAYIIGAIDQTVSRHASVYDDFECTVIHNGREEDFDGFKKYGRFNNTTKDFAIRFVFSLWKPTSDYNYDNEQDLADDVAIDIDADLSEGMYHFAQSIRNDLLRYIDQIRHVEDMREERMNYRRLS